MKVIINKYDKDWALDVSMSYIKLEEKNHLLVTVEVSDGCIYKEEVVFEDWDEEEICESHLKDYFFEDYFLHDVTLNFEPISDDGDDDVMTDYEFYKMKL